MSSTEAPRITALTHEHVEQVKEFLKATYGPGFYGADHAYFDWFYLANPCDWFAARRARGDIPVNAILNPDGSIGAVHAYVPFDAAVPGGVAKGAWDIEWINASNVKGGGRFLLQQLLREVDVYGGFGCNELSENAFRKSGLTVRPEIPRLVWLLDAAGLSREAAAAGIELSSDAQHQCTPPAVPWHEVRPDALPDSVFSSTFQAPYWGALRTRAWYEWRYLRHPYIRYHTLAATPDASRGAAVVRLEAVLGTERLVCRVLDLMAAPGHLPQLLASCAAFAGVHGCLLMDYFTTADGLAAQVIHAGEAADLMPLANPRLPFMFQPLAWSERSSINWVSSVGENLTQLVEFRSFYATKADANQDILRSSLNAPFLGPTPPSRGTPAGS